MQTQEKNKGRCGAFTLRDRTDPQGKPKLREIHDKRLKINANQSQQAELIMRLARYVFSTAAAENSTWRWIVKMRDISTLDQIMQFSSQLESHTRVEACVILQDWMACRSWLDEGEKSICRGIIETTKQRIQICKCDGGGAATTTKNSNKANAPPTPGGDQIMQQLQQLTADPLPSTSDNILAWDGGGSPPPAEGGAFGEGGSGVGGGGLSSSPSHGGGVGGGSFGGVFATPPVQGNQFGGRDGGGGEIFSSPAQGGEFGDCSSISGGFGLLPSQSDRFEGGTSGESDFGKWDLHNGEDDYT